MILSCPFCHERVPQRGSVDCPACSRRMVRPCPYCAEDISVLAAACKYCGEAVEAAPAVDPIKRKVAAVEPPKETVPDIVIEQVDVRPEIEFIEDEKPRVESEPLAPVAWVDGSRGGAVRRWWSTWASSMFDMENFWKRPSGGAMSAIHYHWFLVVQLLLVLGLPVMGVLQLAAATHHEPATTHVTMLAFYAALFPLSWAGIAVSTFVASALWHLPLRLLGAKGGFGTTVRAISYNSGSTAVWKFIPFIGPVIGFFIWHAGMYHAFKHGHRMSGGRALFGALLPVLLVVGLMATALVVAAASGGSCPMESEPIRTVLPPC